MIMQIKLVGKLLLLMLTLLYILVMVSITKFLIMIGYPRAYLSRNRHTITWVTNHRCPI